MLLNQKGIPKKLLYTKIATTKTKIPFKKLMLVDGGVQSCIYVGEIDKVLKITDDLREAKFCLFLTKKRKKIYLPKIYSVYQYNKKYYIYMERLNYLSDSEVDTLDKENYNTRHSPFIHKSKNKSITIFYKYLKSLGIYWYDLHLGNIMKRNKNLVFIDYGFLKVKSNSKFTKEIDILKIPSIKL